VDEADLRTRFESLYAAHAATVARYVQRRSNADTAADVVSEVFLVAWRRLEDVPEDALPWLLGCARRVLWHQQRSERRRSRLLERLIAATPCSLPAVELTNFKLAEALASLSEVDRESLLLTAWEGLTTDQAAQALGCSAPAFRVRAHRARRRLAAAILERDQGDEVRSIERCAND
jgi:RNA polymerase sigma-70 factor (ECF subfamily)